MLLLCWRTGEFARHQAAVEDRDLLGERFELNDEREQTGAHEAGNAVIFGVVDDSDELLHAVTAGRCDDPKLGKVSPDRVPHGRHVLDEEMSSPMQHHASLALWRLAGLAQRWAKPSRSDCLLFMQSQTFQAGAVAAVD